MSRIAKKSDLEKSDLSKFSIGLIEAKSLKITKEDLKGIQEIIPNEKYKIRLTTGNRKAETFYGTLLKAIERKKELTKHSTPIFPSNDMMFLDAVSLFLDDRYEREKRGEIDLNTIYDHVKKINTDIKDYFYKYKLSEINSKVIENFITYFRNRTNKFDPNKKIGESTIANYLKTLNAIFNYLKSKKIIPSNPMDEVTNKPHPRKTKKELPYFQINEAIYALKCLDKFANIRLKTFMNIIFSTGCRKEEACGLRWKDINFNTKLVDFNNAVTSYVPTEFLKGKSESRIRTKNLKTDNSYRSNFLSDTTLTYLKQYYEYKVACGIEINEDDYIFTNIKNENICDPNKLSAEWRRFKKMYKIKDVDLHRIRHTVASILEKNGVPKKDIAKMLGNTERVLEEYYTHVDINDLQRLRNTLDNELYNNLENVNVNIDLVAKILNEYPITLLNENELKILDTISNDKVDNNNYETITKNIKDIILCSNGNLNYFIDSDADSLKIKLETYKKFNNNDISIPKEKDISINRDILSF